WIGGEERPIRQFDSDELLSFLDYLAARWPGITVALALTKVFLWSQARRLEVASLSWPQAKVIGAECHFAIVGKRGVEKWFRVPEALYHELLALRTDSPYVFAAYNSQLRGYYERNLPCKARMVGNEFGPVNLADWFHERIVQWSEALPKGRA